VVEAVGAAGVVIAEVAAVILVEEMEEILVEEEILEAAVAQVETRPRDQALVTYQASVNLQLDRASVEQVTLVLVELSVSPLLFLVLLEPGLGSVRALASVDPGLESPLGQASRHGLGLRLGLELLLPQITIRLRVTITPHTSSSIPVMITIITPVPSLSAKLSITKTVAPVSTTIISNSLRRQAKCIMEICGPQGGRLVT